MTVAWNLRGTPVLVLALVAGAAATSVTVNGGDRECFLLRVEAKKDFHGNFEVLVPLEEAALRQLSVQVTGPVPQSAEVLYHTEGSSDGEFATRAKDAGDFEMCIVNENSRGSDPVEVGFAFRLAADVGDHKVSTTIAHLLEGLQTLQDHQSYMREREELHRTISESTNRRILVWTVVEALVLGMMTLWQIMYIRKFFEVKRTV